MKRWIPFVKSHPTVAVVRLTGMIASGARGSLNDAATAPMLERAFAKGKPDALALVLNSPGGSPVQTALIAARIRRLADEKGIPVYAFVEDVAASGGYWLACAADEIFIDRASIVGSIGVISASFGLDELIKRYGVERRVYTAGKSKSMLDPFQPENPDDVARLQAIQEEVHASFIAWVQERRDTKLSTDQDLFTGDIWVGDSAVKLGLADGIGHLVPKMKEQFGDKVRFRPYAMRRSLWQRLSARAVNGAINELEERAQWARFGL